MLPERLVASHYTDGQRQRRQIVDARQRNHMSRHVDLMAGATWRDPDRVEAWIAELKPG